jgi:tellurite resistance protein TehA-like permease
MVASAHTAKIREHVPTWFVDTFGNMIPWKMSGGLEETSRVSLAFGWACFSAATLSHCFMKLRHPLPQPIAPSRHDLVNQAGAQISDHHKADLQSSGHAQYM